MLTYDYIHDFAETNTIRIGGHEHNLGADVEVAVKTRNTDGHLISYFLPWHFAVDPLTHDVTIHLMTTRHAVVVILTARAPDTAAEGDPDAVLALYPPLL